MKIRRSLFATGCALAVVAGIAAPSGARLTASVAKPHGASPAVTTVDVSDESITCTSVVGTIKFVPPLVRYGSDPTAAAFKATLSGCDDTSGQTDVLSGALTGTLTAVNNENLIVGAGGLHAATGALTIKWKTATGQPKITPTASTLNITQLNTAYFNVVPGTGNADWLASYPLLQVGIDSPHGATAVPTVTGAFTGVFGSGNGVLSNLDFTIAQNANDLDDTAQAGAGIKMVNFGLGGITLNG